IVQIGHKFPTELLIGLNDRDPRFHDLYSINLTSGERQLVQKNTEFTGFITDDDFKVRLASKSAKEGGTVYLKPDGPDSWSEFLKVSMDDDLTTRPVGFDKTGKAMYLIDSRKRDTGALTTLDLKTGKQTVIAEDAHADCGGIMAHPTENSIQAVSFTYERTR